MKQHFRPCNVCAGEGYVPLPPFLEDLLAHLRRGPLTAREAHAAVGSKMTGQTSTNNRLEELRALGLVTREWFSEPGKGNHGWLYRIARDA